MLTPRKPLRLRFVFHCSGEVGEIASGGRLTEAYVGRDHREGLGNQNSTNSISTDGLPAQVGGVDFITSRALLPRPSEHQTSELMGRGSTSSWGLHDVSRASRRSFGHSSSWTKMGQHPLIPGQHTIC